MLSRASATCICFALVAAGFFALSQAAVAAGCATAGASLSRDGWMACAGVDTAKPTIPVAIRPSPRTGTGAVAASVNVTPASTAGQTAFCTYSNTDTVDGTAPPAPRAGAGRWVFAYCGDSGQPGGWSWVATGAGVVFASPAQLARQAYARLTPPAAVPDYNPRHRTGSSDGTVVGFATWLWLDGQSLTPKTATAAAGPNRATVTARPSVVSFDPGDGSPAVVCASGGRAYDPSEPNAVSDCVHRYLRSSGSAPGGVFVLTARVTWTATWAGSGGTGGVLPALTVAAATPVRVDELQAVNE
jgi:hypothetical protein